MTGTSARGTHVLSFVPSEVAPVLTTQGTSTIRSVVTGATTRSPQHKEDQSASSTSRDPMDVPGLSTAESVTMSHQGKGQAHPMFD